MTKQSCLGLWVLLCLLPSFLLAQTNEGTDFRFTFLEHRDQNVNTKVAMVTSKFSTSGTISMPLTGWSENFSLQANEVVVITLPTEAETIGSENISNSGIRLTSQDPVSLYIHQYFTNRSEAATILPVSSLGNAYYAMSFRGVVGMGLNFPSEFAVVAVEDDTEVFIRVSDQTVGNLAAGSVISVTLNAGEVYQVQGRTGNNDLTGSYVWSEKDFAFLAGNSWTEVPTGCGPRDNLLEMMYPVSTWGQQFITVPSSQVNFDYFRVMAAEDGTDVDVSFASGQQSYNIDEGEYVQFQLSEAAFIRSDGPILVAQYNVGANCSGHNLGDPSMVLLNSIEQTRDTVTIFNSRFQLILENYINVVGRESDWDFITIDGQPIASFPHDKGNIGPNDEFFHASITVEDGAHTIISQGCGIIATVYGYGDLESYAYGGGASFNDINANPIPEGGCLDEEIVFDTGLPENRYDVEWTFEDGSISNAHQLSRPYNELGTFPVQLIIHDLCLDDRDTLQREMLISLRQAVDASGDIEVCRGTTINLSATDVDGAVYEWRGPNGYFSEAQFPVLNNSQPNQSGSYEVIGIVSGCATFPAFTEIDIHPDPVPDLGPDTIICPKQNLGASLNPGDFSTYDWQDGSSRRIFPVTTGGTYSVTVTDNIGCIGQDSVSLIEQCPTKIYVPNAFSPNADGVNDDFQAFVVDYTAFQMTIYDRWGGEIFRTDNPEIGWDGRKNGNPLSPGTYAWVIDLAGFREDGSPYTETLSGSLVLLR